MEQLLYKIDSKGKVRVFAIKLVKDEEGISDIIDIERLTGLIDGKLTEQPIICVRAGKAKRTIEEQANLQFNSMISKQKDKGYKSFEDLTKGIDLTDIVSPEDDSEFIKSLFTEEKPTYANGIKKVMLALDPKPISNFNYDKEWLVSKKLDGIRASVHKDGDTFKAISRNGKDISVAFTHIFNNPKFKKSFKALGEDVVLDGELYKHGMSLQKISGISQLKVYTPERHDQLEFWIFDIMHDTMTADERIAKLNKINDSFEQDDNIKIVSHLRLNNYNSIKTIHDVWVKDGFEGAIARDINGSYQHDKKNTRMIKIKEFQDAEFKILGFKPGLRDEDFVFICELPNDKTVEVKPIGNKDQKLEYLENMSSIIGKMLTVKFFNYTEDGSLFLPVGKAIRDYE